MFAAVTGSSGVIGTAAIASSHIMAHRSAGGGKRGSSSGQAIGRLRGGRTTTLHALSEDAGRPRVLLLAPGNQHDVLARNFLAGIALAATLTWWT